MSCDAYVTNLETGATTRWVDIKFTRLWKLRGEMYGIAPDGVYKIAGDGVFPCSVQVAPVGVDSDMMKRMNYATIDGKGEYVVTPQYDGVDGEPQDGEFSGNTRVKFCRGPKGRNVGVRIDSSSPGFSLEGVGLQVDDLSRRVR